MARNQFINGVISSSIQLKLMQERPNTFDGAVTLACQLESIERSAQRMLQTAKQVGTPSEDTTRGINAASASGNSGSYQELAAQVTSLTQRLDSLLKQEHQTKYSRRVNCWHCKKPGHVRRNCPQLRAGNGNGDRSARHTSAVACTLTLKGAVEGYTTHMLVDTGSSVTLLHENVWKAAVRGQKQLSPAKYHAVMAVNGESLVLSGQGDVLLKVGEHVGVHSVLVVKEMTQECLLGTDFLERHNCVIDLGRRTLTIAGYVTPVPLFSGDCASTCHVLVKETVVIPAYHQVQLPVDLASDEDFPGHVGLFEPKTDFAEDHAVVLWCSLCISNLRRENDNTVDKSNTCPSDPLQPGKDW